MLFKSDIANTVTGGGAGTGGYAATGSDVIFWLTVAFLSIQIGFVMWKWFTAWLDRHDRKE